MTARTVAITVAVVAALVAGPDRARHTGPPPLEPYNESIGTFRARVAYGDIAVEGLPAFAVHDDLVVDDVRVGTSEGAVELLEARFSFVACPRCRRRPGQLGFAGWLGNHCTDRWPPSGYGPAYPALGMDLHPGDAPSLIVYMRPLMLPAFVDEVVVRYHVGAKRHELRWTTQRMRIEQRATSRCGHDSMWFGGSGETNLVSPLD